MTLPAAWSVFKRVWWAIPIAGLFVLLLLARADARHNLKGWQGEKAAHALDLAQFKAASAKAIADNIADVRAKESDAATIVEDKQHDLEAQLADARRLSADYARRMRAGATGADPGGSSEAPIGKVASTASDPLGTGGVSLLDEDDVRICTDNTVKALGWPEYYRPLRERYNVDGQP